MSDELRDEVKARYAEAALTVLNWDARRDRALGGR